MSTTKHICAILSILTVLYLSTLQSHAQQVPHYAQYMYNMQIINPAFVGAKSDLSASLLTRRQWVGIEGAPETSTFSVNTRINAGFGFGLTAVHDKIGLTENTLLNGDISYTIITSEFGRLSFGAKIGLGFFNNNFAEGITPDNEVYSSITGRYGNFGFGFLYQNQDWFIGVSAPSILEAPIYRIDNTDQVTIDVAKNNYFITGGAFIPLSKYNDLVFKPSTLIKYSPTLPLSVDINANFIYNSKYEAGISYRIQNSVSAMFSINVLESLRIGYAYENYFSQLANNLSSHELILRLDLDLFRNKRWLNEKCCYF